MSKDKQVDLSSLSEVELDAKLGQFHERLAYLQQEGQQIQSAINAIRNEKVIRAQTPKETKNKK